MPEFHLAEVAVPGRVLTDDETSWVARQDLALWQQRHRDVTGDPGTGHQTLGSICRSFVDQSDRTRVWLVAVAGSPRPDQGPARFGFPVLSMEAALAGEAGEILASGMTHLPLRDNAHLADAGIVIVRDDARQRGIGTAVARELLRTAREAGRRTFLGYTWHPTAPHLPQLPAAASGYVPADAQASLAQSLGMRLEQAYRNSRLDLPAPGLDALWADALPHADGYEIRSFAGRTPDELMPGTLEMIRQISLDAPSGDTGLAEEVWDEERFRAQEDRGLALGHNRLTTVAIHTATGDMAARTMLGIHPDDEARVARQGDTVVHRDHRGHRLGLLVKIANLRQLAERHPDARQAETSNADENAPMLAINEALGFRPHTVTGVWKKVL